MLSFEPLPGFVGKMVFEIVEGHPGRGVQSCTRAHMKALFEAIKLPAGNFEIFIPATRVST